MATIQNTAMSPETASDMAQAARQALQRVNQEMKARGLEFEEAASKHRARMDDLGRQHRGLEALIEHLEPQKVPHYDDDEPAEAPSWPT